MARLLEDQALRFLKEAGIPIPSSEVVSTPDAAREAATRLGAPVVFKAIIPVGGRGKAGAIQIAHSPEEAREKARALLGRSILNFPVEELLVSEAVDIAQEFFASLTFDSQSRKPLVLFSSLGGVDVEAVLEQDRNLLVEAPIEIGLGLQPYLDRRRPVDRDRLCSAVEVV